MRCLVIDDERLARELIEDNINQVPFLELVASCKDCIQAMEVLAREQADLVFLDIQMRGISGLQFLQAGLAKTPMVIMVTAYSEYAVEAFDLEVVDYLLKPVSFERFIKAVSKARAQYELAAERRAGQERVQVSVSDQRYFFVNSEYALIRIDLERITYIEGLKDYIKIHQIGEAKPVIPRLSLQYIEEKLPASKFMRVHRSFIVALDQILLVKKNRIFVVNGEIPLSDHYRQAVMAFLEARNF